MQKNRREMDENDAAEAALEALFLQLEKDLESEGEDDDDDGDITEEEMAAFEKQLEAALMGLELDDDEGDDDEEEDEDTSADGEPGLVDMVMTDGIYGQAANGRQKQEDGVEEDEEEQEDDEEEDQRTVPLEKWQIRRLAAAVDQGRRHVNVSFVFNTPMSF